MSKKRPTKRHPKQMTQGEIDGRREWLKENDYPPSKWLDFCEAMLNAGLDVYYYQAMRTVSKYIIVKKDKKKYMVRFSNHKPIKYLEEQESCDFFVGVTNLGVTTTKQAIKAALKYFNTSYDAFGY